MSLISTNKYHWGQPSQTTGDEEMGACAAVSSTCLVPCAVILCMLRQCPNDKDNYNEGYNNTGLVEHKLKKECIYVL